MTDVRGHMFTDRPWLAADAHLAPWPESADATVLQTGAWILQDERPLPADVQAFLDAGAPPVYFGFGSTRAADDLPLTMVQAAGAAGRRAIVSRGWAGLSAPDGPNVLTIGDVNLRTLLTRVAAAVHHGGAGTTTLAALAGVPQVVVPQIYDQHYFARRVQVLGIGVAHPPGSPTLHSLSSALRERGRAASPAVRARSPAGSGATARASRPGTSWPGRASEPMVQPRRSLHGHR